MLRLKKLSTSQKQKARSTSRYLKNIFIFIIGINSVSGLPSCAVGLDLSSGGGASTPNDNRPSGNPLFQGSLSGLNGQTGVTGTTLIFSESGSYTLRFEGLSLPSGASIIKLFNNSATNPITLQLRALTGNQNYSLSVSTVGTTFNSVTISNNTTNIDVASATLSRQGL